MSINEVVTLYECVRSTSGALVCVSTAKGRRVVEREGWRLRGGGIPVVDHELCGIVISSRRPLSVRAHPSSLLAPTPPILTFGTPLPALGTGDELPHAVRTAVRDLEDDGGGGGGEGERRDIGTGSTAPAQG